MYRRSLDIIVAGVIAALGGLAAATHLPGPITDVLGVGLFLAPGYVWSEAILSQRLPAIERTLVTAGLALILPVIGGFLFYLGGVPLLRPAWIGMLAILTFGGVVVVAYQRYRAAPAEDAKDSKSPTDVLSAWKKLPVLHTFIFGCAAVVALGSVAYSVKSADAQKFTAYTALSMTQLPSNHAKASLEVVNYQGVAEQYRLQLLQKGKVAKTWTMTLSNGQTWQQTIAYTTNYAMVANLYLLPNVTQVYRYVDNTGSSANATPTPAKTSTPATAKK